MQASRYKIQELLGTQGAVSTYQGLDMLSNEPVFYYRSQNEPLENAGQLLSDNIPDILNMKYSSGMTHVVTAIPPERKVLKGRLDDSQLEQFLLDTAQALEDASSAGVIHGDIRPERILFDGSKYLIEGYGIRWELLSNRFSAPEAQQPEAQQSIAGDVYSWAKTVSVFVPKSVPKAVINLLKRCIQQDARERPLPEDITKELGSLFLETSKVKHPTVINLKQTIADAQPALLDNLLPQNEVKSAIQVDSAMQVDSGSEIDSAIQVDSGSEIDSEDIVLSGDSDTKISDTETIAESGTEVKSENVNSTQERLAKAMSVLKNDSGVNPELNSGSTDAKNNEIGTSEIGSNKIDTIPSTKAAMPELDVEIESESGLDSQDKHLEDTENLFLLNSDDSDIAKVKASSEAHETEITGLDTLDTIEHKFAFDDVQDINIDVVDLEGQTSSDVTNDFDLATQVDVNILDDLLSDIAPVPTTKVSEQVEDKVSDFDFTSQAVGETEASLDLEEQAIESIFAEPEEEESETTTGFDVSGLDFSGDGFNIDSSSPSVAVDLEQDTVTKAASVEDSKALQEALEEAETDFDLPESLPKPQIAGQQIAGQQEVDVNELLPNTTQLEHAFAALSTPESVTDSSMGIGQSTARLGAQLSDTNLDESALLPNTTQLEHAFAALSMPETLSMPENSVEELASDNKQASQNEKTIEDNFENVFMSDVETDSVTTVAKADSQVASKTVEDLTDTQEDLMLVDSDLSDVETLNVEIPDLEVPDLEVPDVAASNATISNSAKHIENNSDSLEESEYLLAFDDEDAENVATTLPKVKQNSSVTPFDTFVDDMDDEASAFATRHDSFDAIQAASSPKQVSAKSVQNKSVQNDSAVASQTNSQDDLDTFLDDVLENENNSLLTQAQAVQNTNAEGKGTLFPVYTESEEENIFAKETVFPDETTETTETTRTIETIEDDDIELQIDHQEVNDVDLFKDTEFGKGNKNLGEQAFAVQDDDDLQVIEITEFGESNPISVGPSSVGPSSVGPSSSQQVTTSQVTPPVEPITANTQADDDAERMARRARRAQRRAEAAAGEVDVFKTATDKIAQMQASIQQQKTVSNNSKLTVFDTKQQTIAEKIAAKRATLVDEEMPQEAVLGRNSRKAQVFEEDDYDAIGKISVEAIDEEAVEEYSRAKLTYFEVSSPSADDSDAYDVEKSESVSNNKNSKKPSLGFSSKRKARKELSATDLENDLDFVFNSDPALDSDNLKITAERQQEFNEVVKASPIKTIIRAVATVLLFICVGAIILLALPGFKFAQESFIEQSDTRESQHQYIPGLNSNYMVYTETLPKGLEDVMDVIVVQRPEESKYPQGHEFSIFPDSPLSLDVKGEWLLQARYKNRTLSNYVELDLPNLGAEPITFSFDFKN